MAKWILDPSVPKWYEWYICDNCKHRAPTIHINGRLSGGYGAEAIGSEWISDSKNLLSPYCPFCGEPMDNADGIGY